MSSGFQSNYKDSGYTVNGWYDSQHPSGVQISNPIPSKDIYLNTQQVGVYMLNGSYGSTVYHFPVFCSLYSLGNVGISMDNDDAWLVYPGFGFQLFNQNNYLNAISNFYTNTTGYPLLFTFANGGFANKGYTIRMNGVNTSHGQTASVKIYFRGTEINTISLS
jgi:hypothetical protein